MIDIDNLIKENLKSGDKTKLKVFRNLKAEFQAVKTSKSYKGEWDDRLELQVISKYGKKLEDAICQLTDCPIKRDYIEELEIIKSILPEPVDEPRILGELIEWARTNLENFKSTPEYDPEIGAVISNITMPIPKKEMGTVIKYLKSKFPTADGKIISEIVKQYIV